MFLTHLLYVNYILVFYNGSKRESRKVQELGLYCVDIAVEMNLQKSYISFNGLNTYFEAFDEVFVSVWGFSLTRMFQTP